MIFAILTLFFPLSGLDFSVSAAPEPFGTVKQIVGKAKANKNVLKEGDIVFKGQVIETEEKSVVKILLQASLGAIQIGPNSEFQTDSTSKSKTSIQLVKGSLLSTIRKSVLSKEKKNYEVKTPKVSMGVRGTTFFVSQSQEGTTYQCICEGEVETVWPGGKDRKISKHHDHYRSFTAKEGKPEKDIGRDHTDEEINFLKSLL